MTKNPNDGMIRKDQPHLIKKDAFNTEKKASAKSGKDDDDDIEYKPSKRPHEYINPVADEEQEEIVGYMRKEGDNTGNDKKNAGEMKMNKDQGNKSKPGNIKTGINEENKNVKKDNIRNDKKK